MPHVGFSENYKTGAPFDNNDRSTDLQNKFLWTLSWAHSVIYFQLIRFSEDHLTLNEAKLIYFIYL